MGEAREALNIKEGQMDKHGHQCECDHSCVHYCAECEVAYCCECGKEWG